MALPHLSTLKIISLVMKFDPGFDPRIYQTIKHCVIQSTDNVEGHLMLDEIILKIGLAWNCINNEVTGCIYNELNTPKMLEHILHPKLLNKPKTKPITVYAKQ